MAKYKLLSPTGGNFEVDVPSDYNDVALGASIRFAGGVYGRAFMIGTPGYHEFGIQHLVQATNVDSFKIRGQEVLVARTADGRTTVSTLIGKYHELMTVYTGPAPTVDNMRKLFSTLKVKDRTNGMIVETVAPALMSASNEQLTFVTKDQGSVTVPGVDFVRDNMPRHRGARGRHAEVWRGLMPERRGRRAFDYNYLLGFPTAAAEVTLDESGARSDAEQLQWLDQINVKYSGQQS